MLSRKYKKYIFILLGLSALVLSLKLVPAPELFDAGTFSRAVYDRHGNLLRLTLSRDEKYRLWVPLQKIDPTMIRATLLYEDRYFYYHPGINPMALAKAVWQTYVVRQRRMGASTITMQLARMVFKLKTSTVSGKIRQVLRALQLEWQFDKDTILEAYLNLAPYGGNIEGVAAASLIYFNTLPGQLTSAEAITLAVIPQNPGKRFPLRQNIKENTLQQARLRLLQSWLQSYPAEKGKAQRLQRLPEIHSMHELSFKAPHYVDAVLKKYPFENELHGTLDLELQQILQRQARYYVESRRDKGLYNTAALLVDSRDMSVAALLGSVDFFDRRIQGQVNGVLARRSPGSTLKPFIYALGIDQGLIHNKSLLKDAPTSFGNYNPENFDGEFNGPITVEQALNQSRNIPAIQVASQLKQPDLYDFLKQANVKLPRGRNYYGLSLVLGGAEIRMDEMASLYAILANKGKYQPLRWLKMDTLSDAKPLLSEVAAFMVLNMLEKNPPPARAYKTEWLKTSLPVSWKTGTSHSYRDAWSVAVFSHYILVVWVGNFDGHGNPAFVGRKAAAPLLFLIIDAMMAEDKSLLKDTRIPPEKVQAVAVCTVSGQLPTRYCPHTYRSWFIPGVSPIKKCQIHRPVFVEKKTGLRSCPARQQATQLKVYEFWSSDLLKLFRKAGIPRVTPPPYHPACRIAQASHYGKAPQITSPRTMLNYQLRHNKKQEKIPFSATTDADVKYIYWFLNEEYIGRAKQGETFFWHPAPGEYVVRVIDDLGRGSSRKMRVELVN